MQNVGERASATMISGVPVMAAQAGRLKRSLAEETEIPATP
jgi:hypothetical protein